MRWIGSLRSGEVGSGRRPLVPHRQTQPIALRRYAVAVLPPVLLGGIGAAYAGRVITAHVYGANIGGGLAMLFGPIALIGMTACASATFAISRRRASVA